MIFKKTEITAEIAEVGVGAGLALPNKGAASGAPTLRVAGSACLCVARRQAYSAVRRPFYEEVQGLR
ncbi:MAG: hypothetical protein D4R73_06470 [Deltaproteobacteria bacterium]|nr:MAG: hypothetical protein D4R73_06470 [Deltaproteobacteria bacterium]